jgi:type III secretion system FlhB-like substrate exporter
MILICKKATTMLTSPPRPKTHAVLTAITKNNVTLWDQYYSMGNTAHGQQQFTKAVSYFENCIDICRTLSTQTTKVKSTKTLPKMLHQASHNLAACHNAMGRGLLAKKILQKLHEQFIHLVNCPHQTRTAQLDVLANIDQSLFSLTSQLAYLNQVEEIHPVIVKTENIVTAASDVLLSDPHKPTTHDTKGFLEITSHNNTVLFKNIKAEAVR